MEFTPALSHWDLLLRLGTATLAGCLIGINRDLQHKPAGLRTHALVSIGAAGFTLLGLAIAWDDKLQQIDQRAATQVIQGIITGIGFLGAGVIVRDAAGREVHGLTTAATIWLAASFGMVCGAAYWSVAALLVACTLLILVAGVPVEDALVRWWDRQSGPEDRAGKS